MRRASGSGAEKEAEQQSHEARHEALAAAIQASAGDDSAADSGPERKRPMADGVVFMTGHAVAERKESPRARFAPQEGSAHRPAKKKREAAGAVLERSNSTLTELELAQTQLSLQQGSCLASQAHVASAAEGPQNWEPARDCLRAADGGQQAVDLEARRARVRAWGKQPLAAVDPTLWEVMEQEKGRQCKGIELIASENFTSQAVLEALGSHLTNKYSEGLPGSRYYGGNEYIDKIESLCISRALAAFHLDAREWGVNVQSYSCSSANFAVITALAQPKERVMGFDVSSGGHVSHGYHTASGKKVSGTSIFFESVPYKVNPHDGLIDFETLEKFAVTYRPKILICGGSSYPREWDYPRFRDIANKCGAILVCDMAHISGLIAAKESASPFDFCDVVTSTTHKSLRGPRGGMIFYRKGSKRGAKSCRSDGVYDFEEKINFAVHPSLQGGPHNNHIAALAVALKQVSTPEYELYIRQVKKNAKTLASALMKRGCVLVTGGTDNHLLLWDLRNRGLSGNRLEKVCEMCHMTVNKNAVFGDSSAHSVGGVRIGTPAMTSRGCIEADFEVIAGFLMRAVQIAERVQSEHGKLMQEFVRGLYCNKEVLELRSNVEKFASMFEMPGFDVGL